MAKAADLVLQEAQSRKQGFLVFRLIRGGLSILVAALAAQQACTHPCCWLLYTMHVALLSQPVCSTVMCCGMSSSRGWQIPIAE